VGDDRAGWAIPWVGWSGLFHDCMNRFRGTMTMFNAPFDHSMLKNMGLTLDHTRILDTQPMVKLLEPHKWGGMKGAAVRHIDPAAGSAQKELEQAIKEQGWDGIDLRFGPYWKYAALDPVLTFLLALKLSPMISANPTLAHGYDVENAVLFVLDRRCQKGIPVNVDHARVNSAKISAYAEQAADWCREHYGVSPGSNAAVIARLSAEGYEFTQLTKSGALALDKEVLGDIDHPLAQTVLKRRQLDKIRSTYLDYYIAHNRNGRVHPSINSCGARTGRMSVSQPNFQNLPRVSEESKAATIVRACVDFDTATTGNIGLFCDFSQIETRLLAHLSQDEGLIAAFHQPEDFFVTLARRVFGDPTIGKKDHRRNAIKTWVYAKIYGAGLEKLAKTLDLSLTEMAAFDRSVSDAFPGIRRFQNEVQQTARRRLQEEGEAYYVCPLSGRRHVADVGKEYALVNYLIQGMAAFFFKKKLLELDAAGLGEYMILPVHDEIILEVPQEKAQWAADILIQVMNDDATFRVPIQAEVSYGERWSEKKDWSTWNAS
jgi:DNA polymerase-1